MGGFLEVISRPRTLLKTPMIMANIECSYSMLVIGAAGKSPPQAVHDNSLEQNLI